MNDALVGRYAISCNTLKSNDLYTFYFLHVHQLRSIWWDKRKKTQVDWSPVLDSDHVSRLILLQQLHKLGLVDYSPLDDPEFVAAIGGEGVEAGRPHEAATGPTHQKIFMLLERLKALEIYRIVFRPLDEFERRVLVRAQFYVEQERKGRRRYKSGWENGKNRRRARWRRAGRKRAEKVMANKKANEVKREEVGGEKEPSRDQGNEKEPSHDQVVSAMDSAYEKPEEVKPPRTIESVRPEVELEVIRVGPNPRVVICRYRLLADEIRIHLWVRTNIKFKRGMKFKMHEQAGEDWKFEGRLPRGVGRW